MIAASWWAPTSTDSRPIAPEDIVKALRQEPKSNGAPHHAVSRAQWRWFKEFYEKRTKERRAEREKALREYGTRNPDPRDGGW